MSMRFSDVDVTMRERRGRGLATINRCDVKNTLARRIRSEANVFHWKLVAGDTLKPIQ